MSRYEPADNDRHPHDAIGEVGQERRLVDFVVCERQRHWSALCESHWGAGVVKLRECRSMQQASEVMAECVWALVALDINLAPWPKMARWLVRSRWQWPHVQFVLLGRSRVAATRRLQEAPEQPTFCQGMQQDAEWHLRKAGAIAVVHHVLELDRLWRIVQRHQTCLPPVRADWRDQLWARLPWRSGPKKAE